MNGIDSALASVLSSRIDSLLNIAPGTATTSQTGAAGVDTAVPTAPANATPAPQPSAQTALSAVALTLNAIAHSGGEATPAVLGRAPIWAAAPALDVAIESLPLADAAVAAAANSAAGDAAAAANIDTHPNAAANATAAATASVAATEVPVAVLAAALEQTVADSGLFYEAHLAAWLVGQRSPAQLASEAQNQLVAGSQLPSSRSADAGDASPWSASANGAPEAASRGAPAGTPNAAGNEPATHAMPSILTAQAARLVAGELLASSVSDLNGQSTHAGLHSAASETGDAGPSQSTQALVAAVHPATVPLVRQQLDLLATGQFRWTGEAWPGARLDWTIEQDGDEWDRSGGGLASEDDQPWRTRLTLSLPTLGTVDAELTLTGTRLIARVQASPRGAARLATQGEGFRQRLAAAGIDLQGLTIREIGGGAPGSTAAGAAAAGAQAAGAYARSAAAAVTAAAVSGAAARDDFDWDI